MVEAWVEEVKEIFDRYDLKIVRKGDDIFITRQIPIEKVYIQVDVKRQDEE